MKSTDQQSQLLCPSCRYDVTQTLADGLEVCPECGGEVSEERCVLGMQPLSVPRQRALALLYAGPLVVVLVWVGVGWALHAATGASIGALWPFAFTAAVVTPLIGAHLHYQWSGGPAEEPIWLWYLNSVLLSYTACGVVGAILLAVMMRAIR